MSRHVYLGPLEDRPLESELMRFRLVYEGELKASQRDPLNNQPDRLAEHKQSIRKAFHKQLRQQWQTNKFLRDHMMYPGSEMLESPAEPDLDPGKWGGLKVPLVEAVAHSYQEFGYRFVPLVIERWSLRCALSVLLLRRDYPGSVINAGDIDNRIKTLLDGLRRPRNAMELRGNAKPAADEDPFFVLLEDDRLVTELSVETDTLLDEPIADKDKDQRLVRAIITVELQPYNVGMFNLAFA